jgi:4-carboxymuconolactone decarboxylase
MSEDSHDDENFRRGAAVLARISPEGAQPPWVTFADVAPLLGRQTGYAFGTIMVRPGLDLRTRELATVAMLSVLGGCDAQVAYHVGGALRAGATAPEVVEVLTQVSVYAGIPRALNAAAAARKTFADLGVDPTIAAPRAVVVDFLAALARRDWTKAAGLLSDDVTLTAVGRRVPWAGTWKRPEGVARFRETLLGGTVIEELTVAEPVASGAVVLVRGTFAHRFQGVSYAGRFVLELGVTGRLIDRVEIHGDELGSPVGASPTS